MLKGAPRTTVTLDELGGMVGDTGMSVPDVPHYTAGEDVLLFASTRQSLELAERYARVRLDKHELPVGTIVGALDGRVVAEEKFSPDLSFEEEPLPAVRAPRERETCLARLAVLAAPAAA